MYTLHTLLLSTVGDYAKTKLINLLKLYVGPSKIDLKRVLDQTIFGRCACLGGELGPGTGNVNGVRT